MASLRTAGTVATTCSKASQRSEEVELQSGGPKKGADEANQTEIDGKSV